MMVANVYHVQAVR